MAISVPVRICPCQAKSLTLQIIRSRGQRLRARTVGGKFGSTRTTGGCLRARADGRPMSTPVWTRGGLSPRARGRKKKSVGTGTNGETHTCKIVDPAPDPTESRIRSAWERLARRARMPREASEVSRMVSGKGLVLWLDLGPALSTSFFRSWPLPSRSFALPAAGGPAKYLLGTNQLCLLVTH